MVANMSYDTVSCVLDSWELVRRIENYEQKVGLLLFKKLFQLEPAAKLIFGLTEDATLDDISKELRFVNHARYFIQMIDKAIGMLGPDIELLTEILMDLGAKHVRYGVRPEYFPSMGNALVYSVEKLLKPKDFQRDVKDAWIEVYGAMSYDMIRAQKQVGK